MAKYSCDDAIEGLKKLLSKKGNLESVAAAKIKRLTDELKVTAEKPFNPVEKIKIGFTHFRKEKF
ncbi:unnamed protein product, partial [Ilex paraguariensis]